MADGPELPNFARLDDLRELYPAVPTRTEMPLGTSDPIVSTVPMVESQTTLQTPNDKDSDDNADTVDGGSGHVGLSDAIGNTVANEGQTLDLLDEYQQALLKKAEGPVSGFADKILAPAAQQVITDPAQLATAKQAFQDDVILALDTAQIGVLTPGLAETLKANSAIQVQETKDYLVALDKADPAIGPQIYLRPGLTASQAQDALVDAYEAVIEAVAEKHDLKIDALKLDDFLGNLASDVVNIVFLSIASDTATDGGIENDSEERNLVEIARRNLLGS